MNRVGTGTRTLNFLIDTFIIFWIAYLVFKIHNWYVFYYGIKPYNFSWFFGGVLFVYYFLFETFFARTPGKWATYSKVVNGAGEKPGSTAVFLRSVVRLTIIDMFFIPFLDKTLHDYVSKTEVVEV
ncbi:MAG: RDD family protein [Sphingobacteriia bacterium]|nr:RDD family protein [Sphingobacteriia bacterium]